MKFTLRPYQEMIVEEVRDAYRAGFKAPLLQSPTGSGKCLGKGTPVLMYNGKIKPVESLIVGDKIMGHDSNPRYILSTCIGKELMYKIIPIKGDSFIVNESHILSLKPTRQRSTPRCNAEIHHNLILNISVKDYINKTKWFKHLYKLWRTGVDFEDNPYEQFIVLGDDLNAINATAAIARPKPRMTPKDRMPIFLIVDYFK